MDDDTRRAIALFRSRPSAAPNSAPSFTCAMSGSATPSHASQSPVPSFARAIDGPFPFPLLRSRRERNGPQNHVAR